MKNKCTLLVDSNWLTISRVSVILTQFNKNNSETALESAKEELKDMMGKSISVLLNRFPVIDNIIMMADGGSWRKQLPIPDTLKNFHITYKGNRTHKEDYNWDYIWDGLTEFLNNCKNEGITVAKHSNIEGDDWAWYWSRRLNSDGINTMIWSSDCDLKQLIQVDDSTNAFTVWYNDKSGIFAPEEMKERDMNDIDFFMQPTYQNAILETLKVRARGDVKYINPNTIINSKVICGDAGDNIKAVARYIKNNRTYKFSEKDWGILANSLNINTIQDLINNKDIIIDGILSHKKILPYNISKDEVGEMIDYNIKLVWLNESVIPETAVLAMNNISYNGDYDVSFIRSNYKVLSGDKEKDDIMKLFESI